MIQSDTWSRNILVLMSFRGIWESLSSNLCRRDPRLTYSTLLGGIGVSRNLMKDRFCLEGNKEKLESEIHGVQVFCIQCAVDLRGAHLNSSVSRAQRRELDQLLDCHIQDLDMIGV